MSAGAGEVPCVVFDCVELVRERHLSIVLALFVTLLGKWHLVADRNAMN
jgi:hypothetical protein